MSRRHLLLLMLLAAPSRAAFQNDLSSVRSSSLGGAVSADGSGAADIFRTPAALSRLKAPEASLMYAKPFSGAPGVDLEAGSAAAGFPTRWGAWGLGAASFQAAGAMEENTFVAACAVNLFSGRVSLGASGKRLEHRYVVPDDPSVRSDPAFQGKSDRASYDADVSAAVAVSDALRAGVAVRNVRRADVGVAMEDRLGRELDAGASYYYSAWALTVSGELFYRSSGRRMESGGAGIGVEKSFLKGPFFLRAGANRDRTSAGIGLYFRGLTLDYAFLLNRSPSTGDASTHQVQMTYRFFAAKER